MNKSFKQKKRINFLSVFLILDILVLFTMFRTSNATYTSNALGSSAMEVALYAFSFDKFSEVDGVFNNNVLADSVDINLGDIQPGETKYYKFKVYNYLEDENNNKVVGETNISYQLKVITTTNLPLSYKLYLNQNSFSSDSTSIIKENNAMSDDDLITDGFGTYYKVFPVEEKCFKFDALKYDEYTLFVDFAEHYSDTLYQDLIESIKVQVASKQVVPGDAADVNKICR